MVLFLFDVPHFTGKIVKRILVCTSWPIETPVNGIIFVFARRIVSGTVSQPEARRFGKAAIFPTAAPSLSMGSITF
jgi:hypothetical protein